MDMNIQRHRHTIKLLNTNHKTNINIHTSNIAYPQISRLGT